MLEFIKNKKIVIYSDAHKKDNEDLDYIKSILSDSGAYVYGIFDKMINLNDLKCKEIKGYCADVVIIDAEDASAVIRNLRKQCNRFAVILYDRHIDSVAHHFRDEDNLYADHYLQGSC